MKNFMLSLLLLSSSAQAEIFLGEEPKAKTEQEKQRSEQDALRDMTSKKTANAPDQNGTFGFSTSLGAGANFFAASAMLIYNFNKYIALATHYDYERLEAGNDFGEEYGPELLALIKIPNPTVVTPVAGAGPGYIHWNRAHKDELFDDNQGPILSAYCGLNIALSKYFGVGIHRRRTEYLRDAPILYADRKTEESHRRIDNSIGFYAAF
jgi:hypothetical protein